MEEEVGGTSRPDHLPRSCADFGHTSTKPRAAVLNAQKPGPLQADASGHWLPPSKPAFSLS